MRECELEDEGILVMGGVVAAFLDAFGAYRNRGQRVLARQFGVDELDPDPEQLFPAEKLLAGMKELQGQFGRGFMTRIGQSIYERAAFPPDLNTLGAALAATDTAYYMNHQNAEGKIGHYTWTQETDSRGRIVCDNPYPCAFDQGIFLGMASKFGVSAKVTHVDEDVCRHKAGLQCTYVIEW